MKLPEYLRALRHRNYRIYFFGQLISQPGPWMQQVATDRSDRPSVDVVINSVTITVAD